MKPRKHSELIKAWADGAEIQFKNDFGCWQEVDLPLWTEDVEYRIKPRIVRREGWVNIHRFSDGYQASGVDIFMTREAALRCADNTMLGKIEWEEEE